MYDSDFFYRGEDGKHIKSCQLIRDRRTWKAGSSMIRAVGGLLPDFKKGMFPMILDIPKDECEMRLRNLELLAYGSLVDALRGQGELNTARRELLQHAASILKINTDRHKAEVRRAANSEHLATIAERVAGPNTEIGWILEGKMLFPPMVRAAIPRTAFTALADSVAKLTAAENAKMPQPQRNTEEVVDACPPESSRSNATSGTASQEVQQMTEMNESENTQHLSPETPAEPDTPSDTNCVSPAKIPKIDYNPNQSSRITETRSTPLTAPTMMISAENNLHTSSITTAILTQKQQNIETTSATTVAPKLQQKKCVMKKPGKIIMILNKNQISHYRIGDFVKFKQEEKILVGKVLRTGPLPPVQHTVTPKIHNLGGTSQASMNLAKEEKRNGPPRKIYKLIPTSSSTSVKTTKAHTGTFIPIHSSGEHLDETSYEPQNSPSSSTDTAPSPELNECLDESFVDASDSGKTCIEDEQKNPADTSKCCGSDSNLNSASEIAKSEGTIDESDEEDFHLHYSSSSSED